MEVDIPKNILIVGGGLAGTFLAAELCKRGCHVVMVDIRDLRSASRTAAGLFNVVTGRFAAKTWQAETFLETLAAFFETPPFDQLRHLLHYQTIFRPFKSIFEANEWDAKSADPRYQDIVNIRKPFLQDKLFNDYGGIDILPCGWLDTYNFLREAQQVLSDNFNFKIYNQPFDYSLLNPETGAISGGNFAGIYDAVIFAEGVKSLENPWFKTVPLQPLKGQVILIEIDDLDLDFILSRKVFMLPLGNGRYRVGSTYEKNFDTLEPTPAATEEISEHLRAALKVPFNVVFESAAVRPTTPNRKPILGPHPHFPKIFIQNGLGTKGVLQAPWCATITTQFLFKEIDEFPKETAVTRFRKIKL